MKKRKLSLALLLVMISQLCSTTPLPQITSPNVLVRKGLTDIFGIPQFGSEHAITATTRPMTSSADSLQAPLVSLASSVLDQNVYKSSTGLVHLAPYSQSSNDFTSTVTNIPDSQTSTSSLHLASAFSSATAPMPSSIVTSNAKKLANASSSDISQWKIIGIAVLSLGSVAVLILAIYTFDTWSSFLRDAFPCGKRRRSIHWNEDLKADDEEIFGRQSMKKWEWRIASEESHRYPTLSNLGTMPRSWDDVDEKDMYTVQALHSDAALKDVGSGLGPHPLEPLFRRPSVRAPPPVAHL
ncbi:hypothetical protein FISHEDRAFT_57266 [Fistulina hepatica ATCC 64428]|uniref:Mid2 domain-containing protein n=1 Tax=Fistulina hepatica ATCC 64428 TaxID=1128425 RepID=A0A0D7AH13_9AGAR|nr:hypothetical protein FISHEDRAFT_57266 [Fistulina hepatica ATCC 64428]